MFPNELWCLGEDYSPLKGFSLVQIMFRCRDMILDPKAHRSVNIIRFTILREHVPKGMNSNVNCIIDINQLHVVRTDSFQWDPLK